MVRWNHEFEQERAAENLAFNRVFLSRMLARVDASAKLSNCLLLPDIKEAAVDAMVAAGHQNWLGDRCRNP